MLLRKYFFLLISLVLLQCKETADTDIVTNDPDNVNGSGVNIYFNYLKEYKNKDIPVELISDIERSKKIAEAELISIFQKPEKYGSREIYLDNTSYDKIRFIINEDDELRSKFGKYINNE